MATKDNNWHLSRTISIGHLATTLVVVIGSVIYLGDIKENVRVNSTNIQNLKESQHSMFARIENSIDKMDKKIGQI
jgi:hypothetical protein